MTVQINVPDNAVKFGQSVQKKAAQVEMKVARQTGKATAKVAKHGRGLWGEFMAGYKEEMAK